jgi:hypothetical protein
MTKTALLIGVSQYDSDDLKPLPAAQGDIAAVETVLRDRTLGNFDLVTLLPNPDLSQLHDAIATLFDDCKADDLVLLYFSGHGVTDETGNFYFTNRTTRKTPQGRLNKGTVTPASFVHDLMENCYSDRQVIILDCCHSGAFGMTARDTGGTIDFERQLGGKGRIILTSSAATEYSFERQGEELAIYTRYLVEGIRTGAADIDGDGFISVNELHDYVRDQVRKAAPAMRPERYVFQDGEKILLAAAPRDPQKEFRQLVEQYSPNGEISPTGKRILEQNRIRLNLPSDIANTIIAEVLRPYEEHRKNLKDYEQALQDELAIAFPLSDRQSQELADLQRLLNLTDENVAAMRDRLINVKRLEVEQQQAQRQQVTQQPQTQQSSASTLPSSPSPSPHPLAPSPSSPSRSSRFEFETATVCLVQKPGFFGTKTELKIQRRRGEAQFFAEDLGNGSRLEMVAVTGGRFLMGTSEAEKAMVIQECTRYGVEQAKAATWVGWETPQHEVTVQPFWIGKYPITQAQYEAIMGTNPSHFKGANRPVEQVSWDEAVEFVDGRSQ